MTENAFPKLIKRDIHADNRRLTRRKLFFLVAVIFRGKVCVGMRMNFVGVKSFLSNTDVEVWEWIRSSMCATSVRKVSRCIADT